MHADLAVAGSELFQRNERYHEAARCYCNAELILPHSLYVNVMVAIDRCGPAHTDNPKFRGRERQNTPMRLLRTMLWSGLFARWEIVQATAIWWLNDVEEGGLRYWADGPNQPPRRYVGGMANTALLGDNHHMFHQVERVGPFDQGTGRVSQRALLAPAVDGSGAWAVIDRGVEVFRAPLSEHYRVSVLWRADVYRSEEERRAVADDTLALEGVARVLGWPAYKIHPHGIPREDIKICQAVRKAVGDDMTLMLDSTWSYGYEDAVRVGRAIEELDYFWY